MDQTKAVSKNTPPHIPTECFQCIFSFIEDDYQTLYSILLVNRTWCQNVIPILWKKPFTLSCDAEPSSFWKIITIYLSYLPDDFVDIPEMQNIKQCTYKQSTIFDYVSFLKELNFKKLYEAISRWATENRIFVSKEDEVDLDLERLSFGESVMNRDIENNNSWSGPEYYHDMIDSVEMPIDKSLVNKKLMIAKKFCLYLMSLCRNFELLALDTRGWSRGFSITSRDYISLPCFPGASECLSKVTEFVLCGEFEKADILDTMATYCKDIRFLTVIDSYHSSPHSIANLINAQNGLASITWVSGGENASPILRSFVTQSKSLKTVNLLRAYTRDYDAYEGLAACKNLENLKFTECNHASLHMKALANADFPRLKTIEISDPLSYEDEDDEDFDPPSLEYTSLIHNAGKHLEEIRLYLELHFYPGIIETIAYNCPNLTLFYGSVKNDEQIIELIKLLNGCKKLEELVIYGSSRSSLFPVDNMLAQIGQSIPESLEYLDLSRWTFSGKSLNQFLINCKAKLRHMSWHCFFNCEEHKEAIDRYASDRGISVREFRVGSYCGYVWQRPVCHVLVDFEFPE
ncbi:13273_t:CDS:2 [Funneliformis geosporum]|uniref:16455_t:CDS:1 n=1 Tax=Funneliformis geosporum TaxID=1117311 RepID=A0A9W4WN09_9GLOM|nr:16455_t:CDS:2 [Funneliformis geosporum]CAI2183843.1 13273_t:CDS:2 [Funneliformis geosporum]